MKEVIISLVLLTLISCGGSTGGGTGATGSSSSSNIQSPTGGYIYGKWVGYETLDKFKSAVANNQWAQYPTFASYNKYKMNYRDPSSTTGCTKYGSGIFSFSFCLDKGTTTPVWVTEEAKGIVTHPLIDLSRIKDIVSKAVLWTNSSVSNPAVPYAYISGSQWVIVFGTETFAFDPSLPLGANPTYYKNTTTAKEYSLEKIEPSYIQ